MKVLIVDDHVIFREGLTSLLLAHHIDVVGEAKDGFEAFEQARALHPDVILMDIQMPRCDGLTATRLIKAEWPEIKVVMLTMREDDQTLFDAIKSGASGYLVKQIKATDFLTIFTDLAEGRVPFTPGMEARVLAEFARQATVLAAVTHPSAPEAESGRHSSLLTQRQMQILALISQGMTYGAIGDILGLTERTIMYHVGEILERLHLENRAQLMAYAARLEPGGVNGVSQE